MGGKTPDDMSMCMAIASRDGIGSANKPSWLISAERTGLATVKELYIEEPFSQTMLSKSRSSSEFKCLLNSLGRLSSCLMKLSITLLRSKAVIPVLSNTVGKSIVTATLFSPYVVHKASTLPWATTWEDGLEYYLNPASTEGLDGSGATTVRSHFAVDIAVLTGVAAILDMPSALVRLPGESGPVTVFVGDDTESCFLYRIRRKRKV
ncbi:hypothetical protein ACJIZ3_004159 [Penstemon smallii]|uniref:Uncharacterized protein n=1 Tax=Penstemon smallii TaxID=265156 RepID=A0ABD3S191_9LAMI